MTERVLHLAAINCVLAVFTFNVIVGFWTFDTSGNLWQAVSNSLLVLAVSAGLGAAFGIGGAGLLRRIGRLDAGRHRRLCHRRHHAGGDHARVQILAACWPR